MHRSLMLCALFLFALVGRAEILRVYDEHGTVMLPMRYVADWLGAAVGYDAKTKSITLTFGGKTVAVKKGAKTATVAGKAIVLPAAVVETDGVTYIPATLLKDGLGLGVVRDEPLEELRITNPRTGAELALDAPVDGVMEGTPLHLDAYAGLADRITRRIAAGADPNAVADDLTPLFYAVVRMRLEAVRALLAGGARIDGIPLLHVAAMAEEPGLPEMPEPPGAEVQTRLAAIVEALIAKGAKPDGLGPDGDTALHLMVTRSLAEPVRVLLKRGARVDAEDAQRATPLLLAAKAGASDATIQVLVEHKANVRAQAPRGWTALHYLSSYGRLEAMRLLIEQGADPAAALRAEPGAPVEAVAMNGMTPLHLLAGENLAASMPGYTPERMADCARLLLGKGVDVNVRAENGETPLLRAIRVPHRAIVDLLLERKADVRLRDKAGRTPLHEAAAKGDVTLVKRLLALGAHPSVVDEEWETPLDLARKGGAAEVVALLEPRTLKPECYGRIVHSTTARTPVEVMATWLGATTTFSADGKTCTLVCGDTTFVFAPEGSKKLVGGAEVEKGVAPLLYNGVYYVDQWFIIRGLHGTWGPSKVTVETWRCPQATTLLHLPRQAPDIWCQPLHIDAMNGWAAQAERRLQAGADPNAPDSRGNTPLQLAADAIQGDVAEVLIKHGADVQASTPHGSLLHRLAVFISLNHMAKGPTLSADDRAQVAAFATALAKAGLDPNGLNAAGETPVHHATRHSKDAIAPLVAAGADVNRLSNKGLSPLHIAVLEAKSAYAVERLLECRADINVRDAKGRTPLKALRETGGSKELLDLLLAHGAKE